MNLWKIRDYIFLLSAQSTSTLVGAGMNVVFPLAILEFTGSLATAGIVGVLRSAPYLVLSLPLGALVDRWNRRYIMMACQLGRLIAFFGLALTAYYGALNQWHIYFVCQIDGILFVFFNIAEAAVLSCVVPSALLPHASSTNEAGFGTAMILGPPAATIVYQFWGIGGTLLAGALCYLASFFLLTIIKTGLNPARLPTRQTLIEEITEGIRWLIGARLVLLLACIMGGLNLINAAMPLIAITLGQTLGASNASIGTTVACGGVGSVLGSLCGPRWLRLHGFGRGVAFTTWLHAAAFGALIFVPSLPLLGLVYGLIIGFYSLYAVMQFAYRIKSVPERLQGRVNSACRLIAFSLYPLGSALAGVLSQYWGAQASVMSFTAVAVLLACILSLSPFLMPTWREGCVRGSSAK
ncbi:MFS transporter [Pleomorphomonas sp. PLEO]|uniref:MFS transporter n=1 Tax=Pleomorphomonas sp. PLEO TaxID=3239306 RepID=UPI00351DAD1E